MTLAQIWITALTLLGCLTWAIALGVTMQGMRRVKRLSDAEKLPSPGRR